ncbi:hypothetical protein C6495_15275 [Candidatus Poribacteria bacterium]|nr:MAG: hypothetical protein C6495_15275 [Candidatus Poribacteria bacterium]
MTHGWQARMAKEGYVYILYISATICILFRKKYTYPLSIWAKMTKNALEEQALYIDSTVYVIGQCDKILGILASMVKQKA